MNSRVLLLVLLVTACGKPLARAAMPRSVTTDGRTVYGTLPVGPRHREPLTALPPVATYRWGAPGAHFAGTTAAEDSASARSDMYEIRMATTDVLRISGWREARAGEAAQFELAVINIERSAEWFEEERDPRELLPDPRACSNQPPARRAGCVDALPRRYPPVQVLKRGLDTRVAFAIMRTADSATAWWIAPHRADIQRETLALLHAGARGATALAP